MLWWVGALVVSWLTVRLAVWFWRNCCRSTSSLRSFRSGEGASWAVITGATDGIGKAYAWGLARRGFSILLVGRNQDKLQQVSQSLQQECGVRVSTFVLDFAHCQLQDYRKLREHIEEDLLGGEDTAGQLMVLVNNVGIGMAGPHALQDPHLFPMDPMEDLQIMLKVNVQAPVMVTQQLVPLMRHRRNPREWGLVVNVGSLAGIVSPFLSMYGATKAFVNALSLNLGEELASQNIQVLTVKPGQVDTLLQQRLVGDPANFLNCSPDRLVEDTFKCLSPWEWTRSHSPYWPHSILELLLHLLPEKWAVRVVRLALSWKRPVRYTNDS